MTNLKEDDFNRVLTMAINDGMDAEMALKTLISWIKASPHRNSAFERLITTIDCSALPVAFVTTLYAEEFDLFSNAANRFVTLIINTYVSYQLRKTINCKTLQVIWVGILATR